jgi:hypothetical protein
MHKFCTQTELSFLLNNQACDSEYTYWCHLPSARYEKMNVLWILQHC